MKEDLLRVASALDEASKVSTAVLACDSWTQKLGAWRVALSANEIQSAPPVNAGPTLRFSVPTTCDQEGLRDVAFGITLAFAYPYLREVEVAQLFEVFDGCIDSIRDDLDMSQSEITIRVPYIDPSATQTLMSLIVNSLSDALAERVVWVSAYELNVDDRY
ncbi:MAG: hypothetical protein Q8L05_09060 [Actinomycetota bacterium]|nr:hypothetical protein [Actinomycetota bacterium]MDP2287726.1 hypothetical protein [Actinomycetota bacterium]